jgi:putative endonuclease
MASKAKKIVQPKKLRRIRIGKRGEDIAAAFLIDQQFEIVSRNWRKQFGEIDIIVKKGDVYRFVEVKTRTSHRAGTAIEAITDEKLTTIDQLAQTFFAEQNMVYPEYHIDVITIEVDLHGRATLRYLPDIQ